MGQKDVTRSTRSRLFCLFLYPAILFLFCLPLQLSATNTDSDVTCLVTLKSNPNSTSSCITSISRFYQGFRKIITINEDQVVTAMASDNQGIAIAVDGSWRYDTVLNHGEIHLQVSDSGEVLSTWLQTHDEKRNQGKNSRECSADYKYPLPKQDWSSILDSIHLDAVGIVTWYGHDIVRNIGLLDIAVDTTLNDEPGLASSYAIGIMGFFGGDNLVNEGQLNVISSAEITVDDANFALIDDGDVFRQTVALAEGISGGIGHDEIVNSGHMNVTANSTVDTSEFSVTLIEGPVDVDAGSEAWAAATGIHSGRGGDLIINTGTLNVSANALAHSDNVSINLIDLSGVETVRAPLSAHALAIGIDGDGGYKRDDQIHNSGILNVTANASTDALDVQITGLSFSEGGANTTSEASAIGINGSTDWDQIVNDGNITVTANADTHTDALDVTVFDLSFLVGSDDRDEQVVTSADAQATGIMASDGDDQVTNNTSLQVQSNAMVDVDELAIRLLGLETDVNRTASALATGISGDEGDDIIVSSGQMEVESSAVLDILSLSFDVLGGATNIAGESQSLAGAIGLDGGQGHDDIFNLGFSNIAATASVNSADVNVSLISGLQGQVIRAPIHAQAEAGGILGAEGFDRLGNAGTLSVNADANTHALDMDFSAVDLSSGGLSTSSQAAVTGIDGGEESSEIANSGDTTINSTATTNTETISVTLVDLSLVSDIIDLIFQTPIDTSTTAQADAVGIQTDDEYDLIINTGTLSVKTAANTRTFEFSLSSDGVSNFIDLTDFPDFFRNTPMIDVGTRADTTVIGITSGDGHDEIFNSGSLIAKSTANVSAISLGIAPPLLPELLPGILGALPNIDTTEVETSATAQATGIDSGAGYDTLLNEGNVHSEAAANANSLSVNATVDFEIPTGDDGDGGFGLPSISLEANLVDVGAQSEASATGISTGRGGDAVKSNDVTAKASAQSLATNIAATLAFPDDNISIKSSLVNASTESKAKTEGIATGKHNDLLHSTGALLADSFAESISTTVIAKVQAVKDTWIGIGASVTRANTTAESSSKAVSLGKGDDSAINDGSITAKAHNNSDAVGVDVAITVPADDKFSIIGEGNWVSADTLASSTADGILGGEGDDDITNNGSILADAFSDPDSVGVAVNASGTKKGASIGIALAQAKTDGTASSAGMRGGEGEDRLLNTGSVNSKAKTDTVAVSVAASLTLTDKGVSLSGTAVDGSTSATADASGMTGDENQDLVANEGTVDVQADADATTVSVSVSAQGANKGVGLGLALSRATSRAEANSLGMSGGSQDDVLHNSGMVKSHATSDVIAGSGVLTGGGTSKGLTVEGAAADGSTTGKAGAIGISGDEGEDLITNTGDVDVLADVHATSVSVGATANGTGQGVTIGIALGRATSTAEADSTGISGGAGLDLISSSGNVKSHAKSKVIAGSGALAAGGASKGVTVEGAGVDASTLARSSASGINGDEGKVEILNQGDLDVLADADATSVSAAVSANGTGTGVTFGLGLAQATSDVNADSVGIGAGQYDDDIYNEGAVKSHALSNVIAGSGALAVGGSGKGLTIEGAGADGSTRSQATAVGIDAMQGADRIVSKGNLDVLADADATSVSVSASANGTGTGLTVGVAIARARSEAKAESTGINAGDGHDIIVSSGSIKSHARSLVIAGSGGLSAGGTGKGVTAELTGSDAATLSTSSAFGISGGRQCDYIYSEGIVDVLADVSATSVSVAASGNFTGTGVTFGLGLARASTKGDALSIGIDGGDDRDEIFSMSSVKSHALSNAIAGSGGLAFGGTGKGVAIEAAGADAGTDAVSKALGISGGEDRDIILSQGLVDVLAEAKATSVSVSATANGSGTGVTLGLGLARAYSIGDASSIGISGGAEIDEISSKVKVKSHAKSTVVAGSGALAGGGTGKGLTIEGAAADGLSRGYANASGISGGEGDDILQSEGEMDVYAKAKTTSVSVAVSANGTGAGLTAGVALARAASQAEANSNGISGGANNDDILNTQLLKSHAIADVDAVSVSAAMGGAGKGVAIQGAAVDASTVGKANSIGISGDDGLDTIFNEGTLDILADADSTSVSVAASVSGTGAGVGLGVSVARADTQATANAAGISLGGADDVLTEEDSTQPVTKPVEEKFDQNHHRRKHARHDKKNNKHDPCDEGDKKDLSCGDEGRPHKEPEREPREIIQYVVNSGEITSTAQADADSASVSVQLGITGAGLQAGGAIALAGTQANASAQGIEGSNHSDVIINQNSIDVASDADATTTSVGVSLNADIKGATLSVAVTDATAKANASSTGIAGLQGDDAISNQGDITSNAKAETNAISVSVPIGIAFVPLSVGIADNDATATSNAIGLDGGEGNDFLESSASILTDADSDAFGISVSVAPIGVSLAYANVTADTSTTGIAGGLGDDDIHLTEMAAVTSKSNSDATGTIITATLLGVAGTIFDENEVTAISQSTGISGGDGANRIVNLANINSDANATATGVSVSAALTGATFADMDSRATTLSTGISGGESIDQVWNQGQIAVNGKSESTAASVAISVDPVSFANARSSASFDGYGINVSSGDDLVSSSGNIHIKGNSIASGTSVSGGLRYATFADTSADATTNSTGIFTGNGDDQLLVDGGIHTEADASASGTTVAATLSLGATFANTSANATATSLGITAGADSDEIVVNGSVHAESQSEASGTTVSANLVGGASFADTSSTALSNSQGVSTDEGADLLENTNSIIVAANSIANGTSVSATGAGATFSDLSTQSISSASGIVLGSDDDKTLNLGSINVDAQSTGGGTSVAAGLIGYFNGDAGTRVDTNATGMDLGEGKDIAHNEGNLTIGADSTANVTVGSGALAGASGAHANITSTVFAAGMAGGEGDDLIINKGAITVGPTAGGGLWMSSLTSTNFNLNLAGMSGAESSLSSKTLSTGLDGGTGDDLIHNEGMLDITATSYSKSSGTSIGIFGTSDGGGTAGAITEATGIAGGVGFNKIENTAVIGVHSDSLAKISGDSFTFGGTGEAGGGLTASTYSAGISGDNDKDIFVNEGAISVSGKSTLKSSGGSITPFGTSSSDFSTGAQTTALGMDSGDGEGVIANLASIDVIAESSVTQSGTSFTFGGTSQAGGTLAATTTAKGISSGSGFDGIWNEADITVNAISSLTSTNGSIAPFGTSDTDPTSGAATSASGIDSGNGENMIKNFAAIDVTADSKVTIIGSTFTFGGTGASSGKLTATTDARGITGGINWDSIWTEGSISVKASSSLTSSNNSKTIFGTADAGTTNGTELQAYGINSDAGTDFIHSLSLIDVDADAIVNLNASTYSFGGTSGAGGILAAQALAVGIAGGADADFIQSEETILVDATSTLNSSGRTNTTFGTSGSSSTSGAISTVRGIDGGTGDDIIKNLATINISSKSTVDSSRSAYTFGGGSDTDAVLTGRAYSIGIFGDSGSDEIYNEGNIIVDAANIGPDTNSGATANLTATGGSESSIGGSDSSGVAQANAVAGGIDSSGDDDVIVNQGKITVTASADATVTNDAESGWLTGYGETGSIARTTVSGFGISGGTGINYIQNMDDISVTASGIGYGFAYASGAHLSWDGDGESLANSRIDSTAAGIKGGNETNYVLNQGKLDVVAEASTVKSVSTTIRYWSVQEGPDSNAQPEAIPSVGGDKLPSLLDGNYPVGGLIFWTEDPRRGDEDYIPVYRVVSDSGSANGQSWEKVEGFIIERTIDLQNSETYAAANGNGVTGTGKATSIGNSHAYAYGIQLGNGDNQVVNESEINVSASPEAQTHVIADGDAFGDAIGTTRSYVTARAYGISVGTGDNWITNDGTLSITSSPLAKAHTEVSGGDICIWFFGWWCGGGGEGIASATASFDSLAVGILTGDGAGENTIINNGSLNISSTPLVSGFTTSAEGDSTPYYSTSVNSRAIGIWAQGTGNHQVLNAGTIDVTANDLNKSYFCSNGGCQRNIEAVGIWTGSGDDYILNTGTIKTNGVGAVKDAIRSGAGNDLVTIAGTSSITGGIKLGDDDDTLEVHDSPFVVGDIHGGDGTDTVIYVGSGIFSNPLQPDFEHTIKIGDGTYTLIALPPMQSISVEGGILEINSDYEFAQGSVFMPSVSNGNDSGQLVINGALNISAASIDVIKGSGHHLDGDKHTVLQASGGIVDSISFDEISVPEKTPLLEFTPEITADSIQISAIVKPFKTVAQCNNEHSIADYMDDLLRDAHGDISQFLGEFQALQAGEHARAFDSLNPASYIDSQQILQLGMKQHSATLMQRIRGLRYSDHQHEFLQPGFITGDATIAPNTFNEILSNSYQNFRPPGSWLKNSLVSGESAVGSGFTGFDYHRSGYAFGFDRWIDAQRIVGFSMEENTADRLAEEDLNRDTIHSQLISVYGSYFNDTGFLEATLTTGFGKTDYSRDISIGEINGATASEHETNAYSTTISGGMFIPVPGWGAEVYTALSYQQQDEEGFEEQGAGDIGLSIKSRKSDSLSSETGIRIAKQSNNQRRKLHTELGLAWLHQIRDDNDIDASFIGSPDSTFTIEGRDYDDNGIVLKAGLSYANNSGFSASTEFRSEIRDDFEDQTISATLEYHFD